jgi:Thermopsin
MTARAPTLAAFALLLVLLLAAPALPGLIRGAPPPPSRVVRALVVLPHPPTRGAPSPRFRPFTGSGVDPLEYYSQEPAPLGIVDYGVNRTLVPYSYATTEFVGTVSIGALRASSTSGGQGVSFQLNAFLLLYNASSTAVYDYWVQNTIGITTKAVGSGDSWSIESNVWNESARGASFNASMIQGNGSLYDVSVGSGSTNVYISCAPTCSSNFQGLDFPATLSVRFVSFAVHGVPEIGLDYADGSGWVRYDTVVFPEDGQIHLSDENFYVTGTGYGPRGLYQDAEWVYAGEDDGETQEDRGSAINMSLEYWNGNNLEAPQAAWDFGSDTAETMQNVTLSATPLAGGTPGSLLTDGPGTLGPLYDGTNVGTLNITSFEPTGTLAVNGAAVPYVNGSALLTVMPGAYSVRLENAPSEVVNVTVAAGSVVSMTLHRLTTTTFEETGLPAGTLWTVTVGDLRNSSDTSTLTFTLPNGTYVLGYPAIPGFVPDSSNPVMLSVPANGPVDLAWQPYRFAIPFTESGLPAGTMWWINVSGMLARGDGTTLVVPAANGTDPYVAGTVYEFVADPAQGNLTVVGGAASPVTVIFAYRPTFITGSVDPTTASLTIDGTPEPLAPNGTFNDSVVPGTYTLVATAAGYANRTVEVNATAGNVTSARIALNASVPPLVPPKTSSAGSLTLGETIGILAAVAIGAAVVVAFVALRRRGR